MRFSSYRPKIRWPTCRHQQLMVADVQSSEYRLQRPRVCESNRGGLSGAASAKKPNSRLIGFDADALQQLLVVLQLRGCCGKFVGAQYKCEQVHGRLVTQLPRVTGRHGLLHLVEEILECLPVPVFEEFGSGEGGHLRAALHGFSVAG